MPVLLSSPGESFSSFSVYMLWPPSQAHCHTGQMVCTVPHLKGRHSQRLQLHNPHCDPVLSFHHYSRYSPDWHWTSFTASCPFAITYLLNDRPLHQTGRIGTMTLLFTRESSAPRKVPARRRYSANVRAPSFCEARRSTCRAVSMQRRRINLSAESTQPPIAHLHPHGRR